MLSTIPAQFSGSPAGAVLNVLQRKGNATVKELEAELGVTATAVRQQIQALMADNYVAQHEIKPGGRGRPRHVYSLTAQGRALFPNHYDEFTNTLLREIVVSEGPQKVRLLLGRMGDRLAQQYADQIGTAEPAERAVKLSELLNAKGILAEVDFAPDTILFSEYTCPYYEIARQYRAVCDMEQGMIAQVLRQTVELVACSLDGHHGCHFKIESAT